MVKIEFFFFMISIFFIWEFCCKIKTSLIGQFLVNIQGGLYFLSSHLDLLGVMTLFKKKKEQYNEKKHIYFSHSHLYACPSFVQIHYQMHPIVGILILFSFVFLLSLSLNYWHLSTEKEQCLPNSGTKILQS